MVVRDYGVSFKETLLAVRRGEGGRFNMCGDYFNGGTFLSVFVAPLCRDFCNVLHLSVLTTIVNSPQKEGAFSTSGLTTMILLITDHCIQLFLLPTAPQNTVHIITRARAH